MSADSDGASLSRSSNVSALWIALRMTGGIVGVATLLRLATIGFGVEYKVFFQQFLDQVRNIVELGFLIDPIEKLVVHPALQWLRGLGWSIPELAPHWRSVLTLTWLVMGAWARSFQANFALLFLWALVVATLAATAAGTASPTSWAIALWPLVGFLLFVIVASAFRVSSPAKIKSPESHWFSVVFYLLISIAIAFTSVAAAQALQTFARIDVGNLAMLAMCIFVVLLALFDIVLGLLTHGKTWRERLDNNIGVSIGLDILGVMGAALFIGWIMLA